MQRVSQAAVASRMEVFLRAVGFGCALDFESQATSCVSTGGVNGCVVGCVATDQTVAGSSSHRRTGGNFDEAFALLPDLGHLAAEIRRKTPTLEAEARRMAHVTLSEVLSQLTRWVHALRQKPSLDDSPATFRAAFLESDAVKIMLVSLAHNEHLQDAIRDPLLFHDAAAFRPEQAVLDEARNVLQLTLRASSAILAGPLLQACIESCNQRDAEAARDLVHALKDDWFEVARVQATRALERRIDALVYELQKKGVLLQVRRGDGRIERTSSVDSAKSVSFSARQVARNRLVSLARLCESVKESQRRMEVTFSDLFSTLRAFGVDIKWSSARNAKSRLSRSPTADLQSEQGSVSSAEGLARVSPKADFSPWSMAEEMPAHVPRTFRCTVSGGGVVAGMRTDGSTKWQPGGCSGDRLTLLEHIMCLTTDSAHEDVDWEPCRSACEDSTAHSDSRSFPRPIRYVVPSMRGQLQRTADAFGVEAGKSFERLATQLQQRRSELIRGLIAHIDCEREKICSLASSAARGQARGNSSSATVSTSERLKRALHDLRDLCRLGESVTGCHYRGDRCVSEDISTGQRCRARWMDGDFYDATVHKIMPDGFVMVHWLRPYAGFEDFEDEGYSLVTVCATGGDDSLHRIVPQSDIQTYPRQDQPALSAAMWFFQNLQPPDTECIDCHKEPTGWVSISYGAFLCHACAAEHRLLGVAHSYVKEIRGGWDWVDRDLQYMYFGGNAAFQKAIEKFPSLQAAPISERYTSRFAEQYRKRLDAACMGAQAPPRISENAALQPSCPTSDFLGAAEAAEIARTMWPNLELEVQSAMSNSMVRSNSRKRDPPEVKLQAILGDALGMKP